MLINICCRAYSLFLCGFALFRVLTRALLGPVNGRFPTEFTKVFSHSSYATGTQQVAACFCFLAFLIVKTEKNTLESIKQCLYNCCFPILYKLTISVKQEKNSKCFCRSFVGVFLLYLFQGVFSLSFYKFLIENCGTFTGFFMIKMRG